MNPALSQRTRLSATLTVVGAVLLMCGVIMIAVGEILRLKRGELHGLVSGGVVLAALGLGFGAGALAAAVRPPRRQSRFWAPGHPGYAMPRPPASAGYPQPWAAPPEQPVPEPAYTGVPYPSSSPVSALYAGRAEREYAWPEYAGSGYANSGPADPVRGPFDAYDQFPAGQADPAAGR